MQRVITGATILVGEDFEEISDGFLTIENDRIVEIGSGRQAEDLTGWDASRCVIAPAFLNAHTHVSDSFMKELAFGVSHWEAVMPPDGIRHRAFQQTPREVVKQGMRNTFEQMIECGITAFADFREGGTDGVQLLREAAAGLPIRALALGRFRGFPPLPIAQVERNEGHLTQAMEQEILDTLEVADGFSCVTANDLSDPALEDLARVVRQTSRLLTLHVAESPEYRDISVRRTGKGDVERVLEHLRPDFVVHLTDATAREIDLLAAARMPAVCCPRIQGVMGNGFPRFDLMLERGMTVALGTDNVFLSSPDMLRELDYSSRVVRGLRRDPSFPSARQMLQMITINPARILKLDRELGSIEVGKRADLVIFDAESRNLRPLADPVASIVNRAESRDIKAVFNGGALVSGALNLI